jgi:flagellar hook-associated protein 2
VTVASDKGKIKTAIQDFLTEYNKLQSMIEAQTAITTDSSGKVTAGLLSNETDVTDIASSLRAFAYAPVSSLSTNLKSLDDIGIVSNGNDNSLRIEEDSKFDDTLSNQLSAVKSLFTDSSVGLANKLDAYLERTVGDEGTLLARQDRLTKDAASIDVQITDLERVVQGNRERLTASFLAMEQAAARNNQQLQFLQQRFGASSTSK